MKKTYVIEIKVDEPKCNINNLIEKIKNEAIQQKNELTLTLAAHDEVRKIYLEVLNEIRKDFVEFLEDFNVVVETAYESSNLSNGMPRRFTFKFRLKMKLHEIILEPMSNNIGGDKKPFASRYTTYLGRYSMNYTLESWVNANEQTLIQIYKERL